MPFLRIKNAFKYCTNNKTNLLLVLFFIFLLDYINNNINYTKYKVLLTALAYLSTISVMGYGLVVLRDVANNGKNLPEIDVHEILFLGIKGVIVSFVYNILQTFILGVITWKLHFPEFELNEFFLNIPKVIKLFKLHNPTDTILFILLCFVIIYFTSFFMEIGLAVIAHGGTLKDAFKFSFLKKIIDKIGWIDYAMGYTKIILAIVILTYLKYGINMSPLPNTFFDLLIGLLIFVIEYRGMGLAYKNAKDCVKNRLIN